jgi:hypothetical protein
VAAVRTKQRPRTAKLAAVAARKKDQPAVPRIARVEVGEHYEVVTAAAAWSLVTSCRSTPPGPPPMIASAQSIGMASPAAAVPVPETR